MWRLVVEIQTDQVLAELEPIWASRVNIITNLIRDTIKYQKIDNAFIALQYLENGRIRAFC